MPSIMGVQSFATKRNEQAEILVDFVLQEFLRELHRSGVITRADPTRQQMPFERDDCRDVFDHYAELHLARPVGGLSGSVQLWAQTTTYKGNARGVPEPNKTYEIRETLVEALGLRRWLTSEHVPFRTVHFTLGPSNYTYGWFADAKASAFDLSLYPDEAIDTSALFDELSEIVTTQAPEDEILRNLRRTANTPDKAIAKYVKDTVGKLKQWASGGFAVSRMADTQAALLERIRQAQEESSSKALDSSRRGGADIKNRALQLLKGKQVGDPILKRTLARLLKANPFLSVALNADLDWSTWCKTHLSVPAGCTDLAEYVGNLWTAPGDRSLIARRLLLRIHTSEAVKYVQDMDVVGLTEHNLYSGHHSTYQVSQVVSKVVSECKSAGLATPQAVFVQLCGERGHSLLRASLEYEGVNGTQLKPSFYYIEEALADQYAFVSFSDAGLQGPVGYHAAFGNARVQPYSNMNVVVHRGTNRPLAIIKGKYFRRPEFPRRVKEETYVGLTTKFELMGGEFRERYPGIPLIMFVDMDKALKPPEFAVRRLATAGWEVFFSVEDLKTFLAGRMTLGTGR